jgi:hypothetical protein
MNLPKAYINATEDRSLPQPYNWHPRLLQKLGSFRLVEIPGSHVVCFTNPARLAQAMAVLDGIAWEVVFVDNDSPDGTADAVRALARRHPHVRRL